MEVFFSANNIVNLDESVPHDQQLMLGPGSWDKKQRRRFLGDDVADVLRRRDDEGSEKTGWLSRKPAKIMQRPSEVLN